MCMRGFLTIFFLIFSTVLVGQKMSLPLMKMVSETESSELVVFYVKGDSEKIIEAIQKSGGEYRHSFRGYLSIGIPANQVKEFTQLKCVEKISFQYHRPVLLSDSMRVKSNVIPVNNGDSPLPQAYKGKDVIIGIIDTGIDLTHPDFIDSLGNSKVLYIWDQGVGVPTKLPDNFSYGQQWDSTDINVGICTHVDPSSYYGHGTNVCGVAASNGNATNSHFGSAPDANLIVVASDYESSNWLGTVADGVEYIYSLADSLGMPCVINISAGTYAGSHDGLDLDAQRIDSLMKAKPGRALVCAAGNAGQNAPFHLGYGLSTDTNLTWFDFNSSFVIPGYAPSGAVYFELYADTFDFNNAQFSFGADLIGTPYKERGTMQYLNMPRFYDGTYASQLDGNGIFVDSIVNSVGQKLADVAIGYYKTNEDRTYVMQVIIDPDSSSADYEWRFSTTGQGKFDVWSTSSSILGYSDIVNSVPSSLLFLDSIFYKYPDTMQSMVSSFQCLPDVITVGNYVNRNQYVDYQGSIQIPISQSPGVLYASSSLGPTRLGVTKPTIAAPGSTTMAATTMSQLAWMATGQPNNLDPDGMHRTANGTSMASPSVAGVVALLFESCPDYDYAHIMEAITVGGKTDDNTGVTPNNYYGYGKVDALKSIMHTSEQVSILDGSGAALSDSLRICVDELVGLDEQFFIQRWSTGDSDANLVVSSSGFYYASGIDAGGCLQSSDTVEIIKDPFIIPKPLLNIADSSSCENTPITIATNSPYASYLWSNGANSSTISTSQTGGYRVLVTDVDGCKAYSDTVSLTFFINPPKPSVSVLNDTVLTSSVSSMYQWYFEDTVLVGEVMQTLYAQDTGYYYVESIHPNGCSALSDSTFIIIPAASGVIEMTNGRVVVYPNPFDEVIYVQSKGDAEFTEVCVYNSLGMKLLSVPVSEFKNPTITKIGMGGFSSGIYFLYFRGAEKSWFQKVIKK
jgi:subtilisin family serine protease